MQLCASINGMEQETIPIRKITRQQLAAHFGLSLRTVDALTAAGKLAHFKIGKAVRYDLAEVEAAMRARFHVRAKANGSPTQSQD